MNLELKLEGQIAAVKADASLEDAVSISVCTCDQRNMVTHDAMCQYCWQRQNSEDEKVKNG